MGKKDKKKQGLGAAKTAAKTAKKEQKAAEAARKASGEEDVEAILADILAAEAAAVAVTEATDVPPPSPRVNGTLVAHPSRDGELLLFGGEHFDGARTVFFSDTYTYAPAKGVWSLYTSRTRPPPRSAAAAASYRGHLYLFGGEFASPSGGQFHHFKDLWRLDGASMSWERLELRGGPSPRSGHRLAVSKGRLLVFGGFYDTLRETRYMNDLHVLDLNADELKWSSPTTAVTDVVPSPRSGFQWVVDEADGSVVLYGGFCKAPPPKKSGRAHAVGKGKKGAKGGATAAASLAAEEAYDGRGTVMTDAFRLRPDSLTWARVKKGGYAPSARAGFGLLPHKRLAVLFGGVEDEEGGDEELVSRFHADLFALNLDRGKWHPLTLRPPKSAKAAAAAAARRRRRKGRRKGGGGGDVVGGEAGGSGGGGGAPQSTGGDAGGGDGDDGGGGDGDGDDASSSSSDEEEEERDEEPPAPCGRFNAGTAVLGSTLYVFGGLVEKGDVEVTLDDIWSVDLSRLHAWTCVQPLSAAASAWNASDSDADDDDDDAAGSDDGGGADADDADADGSGDDSDSAAIAAAVAARTRRAATLRSRLVASEDGWTPRPSEPLKAFAERTRPHWLGLAHEALGEGGKALRRAAFDWARVRYEEVRPTLVELEALTAAAAAEAAEEAVLAKAEAAEGAARKARSRR